MKKYNAGQSLIEVVIAISVIAIGILAIAKVATKSIGNTTFARNKALATRYAQESIEEARNLRDAQSASVFFADDSPGCNISRKTVEIFELIRTCSLTVEPNGKTMNIEVKVTWPDAGGNHETKIETKLTSWK